MNQKHRNENPKNRSFRKEKDFSDFGDIGAKNNKIGNHRHGHGRMLQSTGLIRPTFFSRYGEDEKSSLGFRPSFNFRTSFLNRHSNRSEEDSNSDSLWTRYSRRRRKRVKRPTEFRRAKYIPKKKARRRTSVHIFKHKNANMPQTQTFTIPVNYIGRDNDLSSTDFISSPPKSQSQPSPLEKPVLFRPTEFIKESGLQHQAEIPKIPINNEFFPQEAITTIKPQITQTEIQPQAHKHDERTNQTHNQKIQWRQTSDEMPLRNTPQSHQTASEDRLAKSNPKLPVAINVEPVQPIVQSIDDKIQLPNVEKKEVLEKPEKEQLAQTSNVATEAATKTPNSNPAHHPPKAQISEVKDQQNQTKVPESAPLVNNHPTSQVKEAQQVSEPTTPSQTPTPQQTTNNPHQSRPLPSNTHESKVEAKAPEVTKNTSSVNLATENHLKNNPMFKKNLDMIDVYLMINKKTYNMSDYPKHINWRSIDKVTEVRNQKRCACCYIFSAIGALEAQLLIRSNEMSDLSEQQILDCSDEYGNKGCIGGLPGNVYNYIIEQEIASEKEYDYTGEQKHCKLKHPSGANHVHNHGIPLKKVANLEYVVVDNNVLALIAALQFGPVAVNHKINQKFKFYAEGVIDEVICNSDDSKVPNHSTLLVGYNLEAAEPYFIFKNSWGPTWGEQGFFRVKIGSLSRENQGLCLIATYPLNVLPVILTK